MTFDIVTGGAGFIGSHLVRRLVESGRSVRVIDDLSTGDPLRLAPMQDQIDLIRVDLAAAPLDGLFSGADRVFHLAAVPSVPRSVRDPLVSHSSNATATLRLLISARDAGVQTVVVSSSSSVYGDTVTSPKREDMVARPLSPYAVAKLAAEGYARVFASLYGLRTVSLRYFNVFGPLQDPHSEYAAVIPRFIARALANAPLPVHGDGLQTRDFTYVDNVVEANLAAAADRAPSGSVLNIAAGEPRSINELVLALSLIVGRQLTIVHEPSRLGDIARSHADTRLARELLGWEPHVGFDEGLRRTVEWHRSR